MLGERFSIVEGFGQSCLLRSEGVDEFKYPLTERILGQSIEHDPQQFSLKIDCIGLLQYLSSRNCQTSGHLSTPKPEWLRSGRTTKLAAHLRSKTAMSKTPGAPLRSLTLLPGMGV